MDYESADARDATHDYYAEVIRALKDALDFYANENNYNPEAGSRGRAPVSADRGKIARDALTN